MGPEPGSEMLWRGAQEGKGLWTATAPPPEEAAGHEGLIFRGTKGTPKSGGDLGG